MTLEPNAKQKEAIDKLTNYLQMESKVWCAFLLGYAGTGKTFTVAHVIEAAVAMGKRVGLMAPTHKARLEALNALKRNGIAESMLTWVGTVASATGKRLDTESTDDKGNEAWGFHGNVAEGFMACDVIFCDEVSMVDETDIKRLQKLAKPLNRKIIFSGDFGQLRPVKGKSIQELVDNAPIKFELTEIMRTGKHSTIDILANYLRSNVDFDDQIVPRGTNIDDKSQDIIIHKSPLHWKQAFLETPEGVAIAYRNVKVDSLAEAKRIQLHGVEAPEFIPGDRYVVKERPLRYEDGEVIAYVSDEVIVDRILPGTRYLATGVTGVPDVPVYFLAMHHPVTGESFDWMAISRRQWNDPKHKIHSLIKATKGICLELQEWVKTEGYKRYSNTLDREDILKFSKPVQSWLARLSIGGTNDYFEFEKPVSRLGRISWAALHYNTLSQLAVLAQPWAFTAHSAQGSTFEEVFIHWHDLDRIRDPADRRAAKYVAVSRAAKRVHIYKEH